MARIASVVSLFVGFAGAAIPFVYFESPWGKLLSAPLFVAVIMSHEGILDRLWKR